MAAALVADIARLASPWADLYGGSTALETGVLFAHFAGLLTAGGFALAADRLTLRISRGGPGERGVLLGELGAVHRPVLLGLGVVTLTGVAMALADARFLLTSPVFWLKMGAFVLLLANGVLLARAGGRLRRAEEAGEDATARPEWRGLRRAALRSMGLWVITLFFGTLLAAAA